MTQLTSKELKSIEARLRERQSALLEEVRAQLMLRDEQIPVGLLGLEPGDSGDLSVADVLADLNIAMVNRQIRELREIEVAFGRIREHSFGLCIDCGDDIGLARLLATPAAKRCMICQQKHEQIYGQDGHPSL